MAAIRRESFDSYSRVAPYSNSIIPTLLRLEDICLELVLPARQASQADLEGQQPQGTGHDAEDPDGDCRDDLGRPLGTG